MKSKVILFACTITLLSLFSCGDENPEPLLICGVSDPVLQLTWLNELTAELDESYFNQYFYVSSGKYQGEDVFIVKNCCPNCNSVESVYSCEGSVIGFLAFDGVSIDPSEISDEQVIWRGFNFQCGV